MGTKASDFHINQPKITTKISDQESLVTAKERYEFNTYGTGDEAQDICERLLELDGKSTSKPTSEDKKCQTERNEYKRELRTCERQKFDKTDKLSAAKKTLEKCDGDLQSKTKEHNEFRDSMDKFIQKTHKLIQQQVDTQATLKVETEKQQDLIQQQKNLIAEQQQNITSYRKEMNRAKHDLKHQTLVANKNSDQYEQAKEFLRQCQQANLLSTSFFQTIAFIAELCLELLVWPYALYNPSSITHKIIRKATNYEFNWVERLLMAWFISIPWGAAIQLSLPRVRSYLPWNLNNRPWNSTKDKEEPQKTKRQIRPNNRDIDINKPEPLPPYINDINRGGSIDLLLESPFVVVQGLKARKELVEFKDFIETMRIESEPPEVSKKSGKSFIRKYTNYSMSGLMKLGIITTIYTIFSAIDQIDQNQRYAQQDFVAQKTRVSVERFQFPLMGEVEPIQEKSPTRKIYLPSSGIILGTRKESNQSPRSQQSTSTTYTKKRVGKISDFSQENAIQNPEYFDGYLSEDSGNTLQQKGIQIKN